MAEKPSEPKSQELSAREAIDLAKVRAVAQAGYQGDNKVALLSEAVKKRDDQRAERERQAAKLHYLDTPWKPR